MRMPCLVHGSVHSLCLLHSLFAKTEDTRAKPNPNPMYKSQTGHVHGTGMWLCDAHECAWIATKYFWKRNLVLEQFKNISTSNPHRQGYWLLFFLFPVQIGLSLHFHVICLINVTWLTLTYKNVENYLNIKMQWQLQWNFKKLGGPGWFKTVATLINLTVIYRQATWKFLTSACSTYLLFPIFNKWIGK